MQDALQSTFGPWLGLAGFAMMVLMIAPKFITRWRGFRARKRGADNHVESYGELKPRILSFPDEPPKLANHDRFGDACAELHARKLYLFGMACAWFIPILINLVLPESVHDAFFLLTVPLAFIGFWQLQHLFDHVVFYRTGFVMQSGFLVREIDYNAVTKFRKRAHTFSGLAANYTFLVEDESPADFNCSNYYNTTRIVANVIKGLPARSIKNASHEVAREREV